MEAFANLYKGMTHNLQKKISIDDTALNYGSGKIENLFATPRLVAFMVEACARLIDPKLPDGFVSIGNNIYVDHFKPTLLGSTVTVEVTITGFEDGKYTFSMNAYDEFGKIGEGSHARSLVHLESFMNKANAREFSQAV